MRTTSWPRWGTDRLNCEFVADASEDGVGGAPAEAGEGEDAGQAESAEDRSRFVLVVHRVAFVVDDPEAALAEGLGDGVGLDPLDLVAGRLDPLGDADAGGDGGAGGVGRLGDGDGPAGD